MTDYTDTLGKPVRVTVAPDGTTMFLDTVVGIDMAGKPITVSSLNDITGAALRAKQAFYESVCDAAATLITALDEAHKYHQHGMPVEVLDASAELRGVIWPEPEPPQEQKPVDAEKQAQ